MIANIVWISTLTKQFNLLIMPNVSQYICGNVATVRVLLFLMHAIFYLRLYVFDSFGIYPQCYYGG